MKISRLSCKRFDHKNIYLYLPSSTISKDNHKDGKITPPAIWWEEGALDQSDKIVEIRPRVFPQDGVAGYGK
jgi:hypothetical protein